MSAFSALPSLRFTAASHIPPDRLFRTPPTRPEGDQPASIKAFRQAKDRLLARAERLELAINAAVGIAFIAGLGGFYCGVSHLSVVGFAGSLAFMAASVLAVNPALNRLVVPLRREAIAFGQEAEQRAAAQKRWEKYLQNTPGRVKKNCRQSRCARQARMAATDDIRFPTRGAVDRAINAPQLHAH